MVSQKKKYIEEIVPQLVKKFNYKSVMQAPKLVKICVNRGEGCASNDKKKIVGALEDLTLITGQKAVETLSKKAVSNFKLRENQPIGARVTLRKDKMYEFLDRLINLNLPRVRDFRGVSPKGFDKGGNYNLGLKEQLIFPEVSMDKIQRIAGMNITFVTTAKTKDEAFELLKAFGMPFRTK